jgi:hypothetical protein
LAANPVGQRPHRLEGLLGFSLENQQIVPAGVAALHGDPDLDQERVQRLADAVVKVSREPAPATARTGHDRFVVCNG